jgi:hypothetical protein
VTKSDGVADDRRDVPGVRLWLYRGKTGGNMNGNYCEAVTKSINLCEMISNIRQRKKGFLKKKIT